MRVPLQIVSTDTEILRAGSRLIWSLIAAMAVAAGATYWVTELTITWHTFPTIPAAIAGCAGLMLFYRFFRPDPGIIYATELITQILLIIFLGSLLAYGAATSGLPYRDAELLAADRWLGFDLQTYLGFVNERPWLSWLSLIVYTTMLWQAALVFAVLTLTRRTERLQDFAVTLVVSLVITIAIFALFPALGWFGYLRIDRAAYPNLILLTTFVEHVEAVRSGALRAIPIDDIRGLISFPSFHAAAASLAVWALWPVRFIRWPLLVLDMAMVAATPLEGGHYLVDVIGGFAVSACSVLIAVAIRHAIDARSAMDAPGSARRRRPAQLSGPAAAS